MTQREEIEVSRLVGATDAFICRPFYYSGALLGLCAGLTALGIVALALAGCGGTGDQDAAACKAGADLVK